ncbi:MAG: hypothetical protein ABIJ09_11190 [Pseudomonadota bacterium]
MPWVLRMLDRPAVAALELGHTSPGRMLSTGVAGLGAVAAAVLVAGSIEHGSEVLNRLRLDALLAMLQALAVAVPALVVTLAVVRAPLHPRALLACVAIGLLQGGMASLSLVPMVALLRASAGLGQAPPLGTWLMLPFVTTGVVGVVLCRVVDAVESRPVIRVAARAFALLLIAGFAVRVLPAISLALREGPA